MTTTTHKFVSVDAKIDTDITNVDANIDTNVTKPTIITKPNRAFMRSLMCASKNKGKQNQYFWKTIQKNRKNKRT